MILVDRFFWFIAVPGGPLLVWILRTTLDPAVRARPDLRPAARRLGLWIGFFYTALPLSLGLLQLAGGLSRFTYVYTRELSNPFVATAIVLVCATYAGHVVLLWSGRTAELISSHPKVAWSPGSIRVVGTLVVLISFGLYIGHVATDGRALPGGGAR